MSAEDRHQDWFPSCRTGHHDRCPWFLWAEGVVELCRCPHHKEWEAAR